MIENPVASKILLLKTRAVIQKKHLFHLGNLVIIYGATKYIEYWVRKARQQAEIVTFYYQKNIKS